MNRFVMCVGLGIAFGASVAIAPAAQKNAKQDMPVIGRMLLASAEASQLPVPLATTVVPVPVVEYDGPAAQVPVATGPSIELFTCVKYRDTRKIAPCAVPIVVQVADPCTKADPCSCTPRPCVYVEICVPSCGCPNVCVTRNGTRTKYDYGKYAVTLVSRGGRVIVDYDN